MTFQERRQEAARYAQIDADKAKGELMRIVDRLRDKECTRAADALDSIIGDLEHWQNKKYYGRGR